MSRGTSQGVRTRWRVRRASLRDLADLEGLCRASVGLDDYVIGYLPWEIENSSVHVALDNADRIVGMAVYRPVLDGSAWLAMARTHPEYRRQGVNRAIVSSFVDLARHRGVRYLRLWTNAYNAEGVAAFTAMGFREVARFTRVQAEAVRARVRSRTRPFDDGTWRRVRTSSLVRMGRGFAPHGWEFVRVNRRTVEAIAASGAMRGWGRNLLSTPELPRPVPEDSPLQLTMLSGNAKSMLEEGRRLAANQGYASVGAYVPHHPEHLRHAEEAGYEVVSWGDEAILCELAVKKRAHAHASGSARAGRTRS